MDPYQIGQAGSGRNGFSENSTACSDNKWHGVREFWVKSYKGVHIPAYDEGATQADADIQTSSTANRDALYAIEVSLRDTAWQAKRDGYEDKVLRNQ